MVNLYFSEEDGDRLIVVEFKDGSSPVKIRPCWESYEIAGSIDSIKKAQAIAVYFNEWLHGGEFPWNEFPWNL